MSKMQANVVLYAVDLGELREWVGSKDQARFAEGWKVIRDDPDTEWDPEELTVLERLLRRLVIDGQLYEGLDAEERYYLTQVLIDLFDEFVDQDALSEDIPLDRLAAEVDALPRESEAGRMARWLVRGRELGGDGLLWTTGPVGDVVSFLGYVTRDEAPRLAAALDAVLSAGQRGGARRPGRPSGLLKQLRAAAAECARAELDLLSFVG